MKNNKGAQAMVLVTLIIVVMVVGLFFYNSTRKEESGIKLPSSVARFFNIGKDEFELAKEGLSGADDIDTIEEELNDTLVGSPDSDLRQLDSSASSL